MVAIQQPQPWGCDQNQSYVPLMHEGTIVGLCKPDYASLIAEALNQRERLQKAIHLACYDLVARSGGSSTTVDDLVQQYLSRVDHPTCGTAAIAFLLRDRQDELDLTDEEFARFCDTFRLSRVDLQNIYAGEELESTHLTPLSRILGKSVDEIIAIWKSED